MSSALHVVDEFFQAATSNDIARASGMLAEEVTFDKNATPTQQGREATMGTMLTANDALISTLQWHSAEQAGPVIRITGVTPEGSGRLGYIMTVTVSDGKITAIQQQDIRDARIAGGFRGGQTHDPIRIPDVIKAMIAAARDAYPLAIAAVDAKGQPLISNRGSIHAFSDTQLALWLRNPEGDLATAIGGQPRVAVLLREQTQKAAIQFQGRARISHDEAERERVFLGTPVSEQKHDFARVGAAVIIDLDLIEGYMTLGPNAMKLSQRC